MAHTGVRVKHDLGLVDLNRISDRLSEHCGEITYLADLAKDVLEHGDIDVPGQTTDVQVVSLVLLTGVSVSTSTNHRQSSSPSTHAWAHYVLSDVTFDIWHSPSSVLLPVVPPVAVSRSRGPGPLSLPSGGSLSVTGRGGVLPNYVGKRCQSCWTVKGRSVDRRQTADGAGCKMMAE